jgi:hypothetical protein
MFRQWESRADLILIDIDHPVADAVQLSGIRIDDEKSKFATVR